jgi:hypothetical protein
LEASLMSPAAYRLMRSDTSWGVRLPSFGTLLAWAHRTWLAFLLADIVRGVGAQSSTLGDELRALRTSFQSSFQGQRGFSTVESLILNEIYLSTG